jgi:hypothetical protein
MKFLLSYKIFEKTSLIGIGVPYSVMQSLQKNYALSDDAQWKSLKYKKDIISAIQKPKNNLIISIYNNKLFVIYSFNKELFLETYILTEKDDFGNEQWERISRIKDTITNISKKIEKGNKSYELISGNWANEFSSKRKIKKEESDFEQITNEFKKDFAENFTKIVKQLYGRKANVISNIIVDHLKNTKKNLTDDQIRNILFLNVDRAKEVDTFKKKQKEKDPYHLYNQIVRSDSLTIFNEYLIKFENEYSDKYGEYLNIPIMIEKFTRDKVMTAFMIYLYINKLIEL